MDHIESCFVRQPFASRTGEVRAQTGMRSGSKASPSEFPRVYGLGPWVMWSDELGLSMITRWMLVTLAWLQSDNASVFPSQRFLAHTVGCSTSSIRSSLRELEELGILRSVARFESRSFTGKRQTSNRYEFLRWPSGVHKPLPLTVVEELVPLEIENDGDEASEQVTLDEACTVSRCPGSASVVEGSSEPGRAEPALEARPRLPEAEAAAVSEQGQAEPARVAPAVEAVRESAEAPVAPEVALTPALAPESPPFRSCAPPPQEVRGMEDLEEKLKANSTRAREAEPARGARSEAPASAAAFLSQVLVPEQAQALKRRFGLSAYGSLLFVLRRQEYREHPELVSRLLSRLCEAPDVRNPGAWFCRVFTYEREAAELVGAPTAEEQALEAERLEAAQLLARQRALEAKLERVRGRDAEVECATRAELEAVVRARRRAAHRSEPETRPSSAHVCPEGVSASAPLPASEQAAEAARVLAMLRGRAA